MAAQPMTETMKISDVKQQLNSLVNRVYRQETRVMVEKSGIPVAAIVSARDLQRLEQLDRKWAEGERVLREFAAGFADQTPEDIERETAKAIAEVRAEKWAE
ncbi:MAG: type II toxin-antitoxin system Phd/YefM family antitoxin [Chloroflexia bacterium]|nr:type II toxin-antitoxin system Phd/YefM family antitoxin [Chloroflexia bacterium]